MKKQSFLKLSCQYKKWDMIDAKSKSAIFETKNDFQLFRAC